MDKRKVSEEDKEIKLVIKITFLMLLCQAGGSIFEKSKVQIPMLENWVFPIIAIIFLILFGKLTKSFFSNDDSFNLNTIVYSIYYAILVVSVVFGVLSISKITRPKIIIILFVSLLVGAISINSLYFLGCRTTLRIVNSNAMPLLYEKFIRSLLVAITAWITILANLYVGHLKVYYQKDTAIALLDMSAFISNMAACYYPILDMFEFCRNEIDKTQKAIASKL